MTRQPRRRERRADDREHAVTQGGRVIRNYLQQPADEENEGEHKPDVTTDPKGVTER